MILVGGLEPYPLAPPEVLGFSRLERLPDECAFAPPFLKPHEDCSECEYAELGEGRSMSARLLPAEAPLEYVERGVNAVVEEGGGSSDGVKGWP